ncbi:hypothetical protein KIPB_005768 [Kipferlia bialata]|uniref:Uncharacterized protein n=1 Tax=Kipferlia bialata TaxID=797122 RepID=A0A9K3CXP6_9EUKA|nr:hypothetical protein KIPB_005768 [Kipferlia bialata]|eukprot:g5768.t1
MMDVDFDTETEEGAAFVLYSDAALVKRACPNLDINRDVVIPEFAVQYMGGRHGYLKAAPVFRLHQPITPVAISQGRHTIKVLCVPAKRTFVGASAMVVLWERESDTRRLGHNYQACVYLPPSLAGDSQVISHIQEALKVVKAECNTLVLDCVYFGGSRREFPARDTVLTAAVAFAREREFPARDTVLTAAVAFARVPQYVPTADEGSRAFDWCELRRGRHLHQSSGKTELVVHMRACPRQLEQTAMGHDLNKGVEAMDLWLQSVVEQEMSDALNSPHDTHTSRPHILVLSPEPRSAEDTFQGERRVEMSGFPVCILPWSAAPTPLEIQGIVAALKPGRAIPSDNRGIASLPPNNSKEQIERRLSRVVRLAQRGRIQDSLTVPPGSKRRPTDTAADVHRRERGHVSGGQGGESVVEVRDNTLIGRCDTDGSLMTLLRALGRDTLSTQPGSYLDYVD